MKALQILLVVVLGATLTSCGSKFNGGLHSESQTRSECRPMFNYLDKTYESYTLTSATKYNDGQYYIVEYTIHTTAGSIDYARLYVPSRNDYSQERSAFLGYTFNSSLYE